MFRIHEPTYRDRAAAPQGLLLAAGFSVIGAQFHGSDIGLSHKLAVLCGVRAAVNLRAYPMSSPKEQGTNG